MLDFVSDEKRQEPPNPHAPPDTGENKDPVKVGLVYSNCSISRFNMSPAILFTLCSQGRKNPCKLFLIYVTLSLV